MYKIKYFDTPFWSVTEAEEREGGWGGGASWQVTRSNILSYIYSTTPNRYTLSQHNTFAENVKFWLKTAQQREITPTPLYTGGPCGEEVRCGGGAWHRVGDDHDRQVIPVSSILPQPLFCLHTTQQREITPAALYTGGSCITGGVTSMVMLCLPSIWVNNVNDHHKSCNFKKKMKKILNIWGVMAPVLWGGVSYSSVMCTQVLQTEVHDI